MSQHARPKKAQNQLTVLTRSLSTPSALALCTSASTFSGVLARYPAIFATFVALCAALAGAPPADWSASDRGGYIADQNWRRNSLAAVWQVVIWRRMGSGISSVQRKGVSKYRRRGGEGETYFAVFGFPDGGRHFASWSGVRCRRVFARC